MTGESELIRSFIAVIPPDDVLNRIEAYLEQLKPLVRCRWVPRKQLHITMRFLGEHPTERIEAIERAIDGIHIKPFEVKLNCAGFFPNAKSPRILWLGSKQEIKELKILAEEIEAAAVSSGFPPEKRGFRPHLTIGRLHEEPLSENFIDVLRSKKFLPYSWTCRSFSLMRSCLTPQGPIYTQLATRGLAP